MAETAVSLLIDRLVPLLTQEAKLLRGIHGEVADIKDELESIHSFLKDADARAAIEEVTSEGVKTHNEGRSEILPESIFPSAMSPSDSQSPLFFPDNMSPKFSHSNSIELIFPPARSETTDSSQNDEAIIQKPFISSFSHLYPPGTTSDSDSANSICDYGPTTHSISLLFPANESDTETETETGSLAFNGTTSNLSHSIMQFYLSHSIMQFFPPDRSPSQTDSSENYVITRTDIDGCVFNGTPPAHSLKFSGANSIELFFPIVKTWVKQVREVAFRIDVAIDRYLLDVAQHDPHRRGVTGFVHKTAHLLKTLKSRHKMASEIQEIKASFQKIKERSDRYQFKFIDQGSSSSAPKARWSDPRMDSLYLDDIDVVGIEFHRDIFISWLVNGPPHRTVLSVVGMGGLGKTTLVKKVYDHQIVRGHFVCHAWVSVSQSYNIEDLLRSMIKQFCEVRMELPPVGMDTMDEESLIKYLRVYLQQKRYVVVFDDVWKIDFWEDIKHALLDNIHGCRILITTRMWEVVNFCKKSSHVYAHQLQPLRQEKAWELFCNSAFRFYSGGLCPMELEKLSREIVMKCQGLPLAITAIGGLLSTKNKTLFEWRKLHDNLGFELGRNPHLASVNKVLSLSFEDLPYHLKSCLLYFGMYPVSFSLSCRILIKQWIAEGFVNKINDKALEDIGQEYLIELIDRSLVQVLKTDYAGVVVCCRIHDLLHEIILQKMEDLSFCHALSKEESSFEGLTRRLSVSRSSLGVLEQFKKSHIHSLLFFNINEFPISFISKFLQNFKLVKVLDFENTPLDHLPEEVGNLFHLRYLNLNNTKVKTLPNSIGKLQNLETLLMLETAIQEIPVTIKMLHKLRHLVVRYFDAKMEMSLNIIRGVKLHWSIGSLKALTELQYVDANYGGVKLIEELGKLSQLTDLGLVNLTRETGRALCVSIENMNCLKHLFVSSINEDEVIDLQPISSPPKCLQFLCIEGRLAKLPDWISELQHLVSLKIYWTRLSDDPLKAFQNLPNLAGLVLGIKAYNGEQLHIGKGGFPKLKELQLRDLSELNSLNVEKEAFPLLEKLHIGDCPQLKEVPSGFQHLRNLKELIITFLDPEQGSHYWIIQHVPSILLSHKVREGIDGYERRNLRSKDLERSRGKTINQDDDNKNNISGDDINASVEKDIQGIPWDRLSITREKYRQARLEQYRNYENIPHSGEGSQKDCKVTKKGSSYYEFRRNSRSVKPTIPHFQLRNLVWATSKHDVYLLSHFSVIHWSSLNCTRQEVLNVSGHVAPSEKLPGNLLEGFTQTQVSSFSVKEKLLVAGGFQGELICKHLDQPGVSFCSRTTSDDNASTNSVEIYVSSSGAFHFTASNNDCGVRDFDMEKFQLSKHFQFPWPVNHTSVSPDGKLLTIVGDNPEGILVDSQTGKTVMTLCGHLDFSFASAWHPDNVTLATGNQDKTCRVWDVRNLSKSVAVLKGNIGAIRSIRYSSDGQYMAMAEAADFVHVYDAKNGYEKEQEIDFFGDIAGISFSPDAESESLFIGVCELTFGSLLEYGRCSLVAGNSTC